MFFGVVSLLFAGFGLMLGGLDPVPTVLGIGLTAVAVNEYRGAAGLGRLRPGAPIQLALGQIALGTLIIGYCLWMIARAQSGQMMASSDPQVRELLGDDFESLYKGIAMLLYGTVIAATVLFQGSAAAYYLTRRRHLRAYLTQTPDWIVDFERLRGGDRAVLARAGEAR